MARQLQEEDEALARQMQEESDAALAAWCAAQDEQRRAAARPAKPRPAYGDNEFGEPDTPPWPVQPKPRKQHPVSPLRERNHDSEFGEPGCNSPSTQRRPSAKVAPQGYLSNVQDPALSSEDLKAFVAAAAPVVGAVRNLTTRALSFSRGSDARFHAGPCRASWCAALLAARAAPWIRAAPALAVCLSACLPSFRAATSAPTSSRRGTARATAAPATSASARCATPAAAPAPIGPPMHPPSGLASLHRRAGLAAARTLRSRCRRRRSDGAVRRAPRQGPPGWHAMRGWASRGQNSAAGTADPNQLCPLCP